MAAYPSGVYAPASKSAGQVIQAGFFNDPDAEIVAVETGLVNGLAHPLVLTSTFGAVIGGNLSVAGASTLTTLQAGASTVTTLSAGASTVTTLQVSGVSTFTGAVTFAVRPVLPPPDLALLTGSTSQFASGSSGGVSWPTQALLTNSSLHSTGTNPDRLSPQSTGVYALSVSVSLAAQFADPSTGTIDISIKDSSGARVEFVRVNGSAGGRPPSITGFGMKHFDTLAASPYLRIALLQRGGSTASLDSTLSFLRFYKL